jgi:hypothetical protein
MPPLQKCKNSSRRCAAAQVVGLIGADDDTFSVVEFNCTDPEISKHSMNLCHPWLGNCRKFRDGAIAIARTRGTFVPGRFEFVAICVDS